MKERKTKETYTQIIKANNWFAIFKNNGGEMCCERVAVWVIKRETNINNKNDIEDFVEGLVALEYLSCPETFSNFVRYAHKSELSKLGIELEKEEY